MSLKYEPAPRHTVDYEPFIKSQLARSKESSSPESFKLKGFSYEILSAYTIYFLILSAYTIYFLIATRSIS